MLYERPSFPVGDLHIHGCKAQLNLSVLQTLRNTCS